MNGNQMCYHYVRLKGGRDGLKSDVFRGPNGSYCKSNRRNKGRDEYMDPDAIIYKGKTMFPLDVEECKGCPHYAAS